MTRMQERLNSIYSKEPGQDTPHHPHQHPKQTPDDGDASDNEEPQEMM